MKKLWLLAFLSSMAYAGNIQSTFDTRPILPAVQKMRTMDWTWQNVATFANASSLSKDENYKGYYSQHITINDENPNITIVFYGTKAKPEVAVIEARTWGANTQETLFPRLDMLKGNIPLKSNCNFKKIGTHEKVKDKEAGNYETGANLLFQQAYILPKNLNLMNASGTKDLYVSSSQVETFVITLVFQTQAYTLSIISPDKDKLGKFISTFGWNTNKQGKTIQCTVQ